MNTDFLSVCFPNHLLHFLYFCQTKILEIMGYSNFRKIKTVSKKFNIDVAMARLFENVPPVEPCAWLVETLQMAELMPLMNEKTKSERIVSPILLEIVKSYADRITLFSGESIDIRPEDDLEVNVIFSLLYIPQNHLLILP